jgi:hypothetical protein
MDEEVPAVESAALMTGHQVNIRTAFIANLRAAKAFEPHLRVLHNPAIRP